MNDKDFQLRNDAFTDDLREALRRRETKRPPVEAPDDFLDSVMQQVEPDRTHTKAKTLRIAFSSLAIAACTITAVLLVWPKGDEKQSDVSELQVRKERTPSPSPANLQSVTTEISVAPTPVAMTYTEKRQVSQQTSVQTQSKDELDDYMAELEKGLADVRDSCYLAQVEHMISGSEDLQQLMDEMTNQTLYNGNYE